MNNDLTELLRAWSFDPDHTLRIITAGDGRQVLQVRLPLGIEQYELSGRPDGSRPFGKASFVDEIDRRLRLYVAENATDVGFTIKHDDAVVLQNEGILYYYRYLLLFQLNDFPRVIEDTDHNLRLCSLLERYCTIEEDRVAVLQFRPYILRMNAIARAMAAAQEQRTPDAIAVLTDAIGEIEQLAEVDSPAFQFERLRSINYLKSALKQVENDADPVREWEQRLAQALEEENYERAAELRDMIRAAQTQTPPRDH